MQLELEENIRQKCIAIFVSPHKSRIFYLDITVEERIVISDTFAVRELVADAKELRQYLILVLSNKQCRFFLTSENRLELLTAEIPTDVYAYVNEKPERVANFSDPEARKQAVLDKYLHHMDQELSRILSQYPLPVFVMGPERVVGHLKAHSRHLPQIEGYVHGNYLRASEPELRTLIKPSIEDLRLRNHQRLINLLHKAADGKKLSRGFSEAWYDSAHDNGHLLIVEKSYQFHGRRGERPDQIFPEDRPEENPFCIPDAVDALIGQVILRGGDVEFVADGDLIEYDRIALIKYY